MNYSSINDLSSLVVDAEDQMARFVAKTYIVCSRLVVRVNVLDLGTEAAVDVTGEVSFDNRPIRGKKTLQFCDCVSMLPW